MECAPLLRSDKIVCSGLRVWWWRLIVCCEAVRRIYEALRRTENWEKSKWGCCRTCLTRIWTLAGVYSITMKTVCIVEQNIDSILLLCTSEMGTSCGWLECNLSLPFRHFVWCRWDFDSHAHSGAYAMFGNKMFSDVMLHSRVVTCERCSTLYFHVRICDDGTWFFFFAQYNSQLLYLVYLACLIKSCGVGKTLS